MKAFVTLLRDSFRGYERKHLQLISAGLAFYFALSLFPAIILLTAVMAYLPVRNGAERATAFIAHVVPQQALSLVEPLVNSITLHRSGLLWLGILTTLWLVSLGAKAIIQGLDIVYEVAAPRPLWMNRFLAFILTAGVGTLLLLAVVLTVAGPIVETLLQRTDSIRKLWIYVWPYLQWLLAITFTFAAIEVLYRLAPNIPAGKRTTIPGAIVAAVGWLILAWLLGFFFHEFTESQLNGMYGVLATPIALLTWLKWGANVIVIGAEINVNLQSATIRGDPEPK
ncbi:MAG: YihY/virulence factor BrkB family protein [Bryobacterales bacterium]|nr:YihY/virulence factor BrkB family protein [Bryobacterales bacterium]MBV9400717.1 YihY/virulence factor BrkB family protein [Bryobacterales bacterium]